MATAPPKKPKSILQQIPWYTWTLLGCLLLFILFAMAISSWFTNAGYTVNKPKHTDTPSIPTVTEPANTPSTSDGVGSFSQALVQVVGSKTWLWMMILGMPGVMYVLNRGRMNTAMIISLIISMLVFYMVFSQVQTSITNVSNVTGGFP